MINEVTTICIVKVTEIEIRFFLLSPQPAGRTGAL